jgi:Mg2+ and Co2+ transporter CorA
MLLSIRRTLTCLRENANEWKESALLLVSFEELVEETKLLLERTKILDKQVKAVSIITRDLSVHHNSLAMMKIAESTKDDSMAMKIITIITVLFLPATFVAVCHPTPVNC